MTLGYNLIIEVTDMATTFMIFICFYFARCGLAQTDYARACNFRMLSETWPESKIDCNKNFAVSTPLDRFQCMHIACAAGSNAFTYYGNPRRCQVLNCSDYLINTNEVPTTTIDARGHESYVSDEPNFPENCTGFTQVFSQKQTLRYRIPDSFQLATYNTNDLKYCHALACSGGYNVYEYDGSICRFYIIWEPYQSLSPTSMFAGSFDIFISETMEVETTTWKTTTAKVEATTWKTTREMNSKSTRARAYWHIALGAGAGALFMVLVTVVLIIIDRKIKACNARKAEKRSVQIRQAQTVIRGVPNVYEGIGNDSKSQSNVKAADPTKVTPSGKSMLYGPEPIYLEIDQDSVQPSKF